MKVLTMKITLKALLLVTILLLLTSCPLPNEDNKFTISWDSDKCRLFIDGKEVTGGEYSRIYGIGAVQLTLEAVPYEEDGWFFSSFTFNAHAFPHGAYFPEKENPFTFEVSEKYSDCYIHLDRYLIDSFYDDKLKKIVFSVSYPNKEGFYKYFTYSVDSELLTETTDNYFKSIRDQGFELNNSTVFIKSDPNFKILVPGNWNELHPASTESHDGTKALIGVTGPYFEDNFFIWDYQSNELLNIGISKRVDTVSWNSSDNKIYFTDYSSSSLNLNEAVTTIKVKEYDCISKDIKLIKEIKSEPGESIRIEAKDDYYIYHNRGKINIYDYNNNLLLDPKIEIQGHAIVYNRLKNHLYVYRDYDIYVYKGDENSLQKITNYKLIK